jgi:hypothetical protein
VSSSYVQTAFTGGEISQSAQGRLDQPWYRISMNACLNWIPLDTGGLQRRPGTLHAAVTRGGAPGRGIPFAFEQSYPYVMQFTDGFLRFTTGPSLVMTNDAQAVTAISTANPAVVQTALPHGWATGNSVMWNSLGANNPLLQNRQFAITVIDTTHFSLADAITGATIDGSTLGAFVSGNVTRILEIATTWSGGTWSSLRSVQAEARTVLLNGTVPQILQVETPPAPTQFATFTFAPADFVDGPYLDPIPGSQMTPSGGTDGVITLTLSFVAWVSTQAYDVGDYVTYSGQSYQSLTALNQNNEPDIHSANWLPVNAGAAVNGGTGFVASDIGRLIRLFQDTSWTWAQIVSVSGVGLIAPVSAIGSLGSPSLAFDGNISKAFASSSNFFNGIATFPAWQAINYSSATLVQYGGNEYSSRIAIVTSTGAPGWSANNWPATSQVQYNGFVWQANTTVAFADPPPGVSPKWSAVQGISTAAPPSEPSLWSFLGSLPSPTLDEYIGQHYTTAQAIYSATLYPTTDIGFSNAPNGFVYIFLRGSNTAPTSASNGTLLASTGGIGNTLSPITLVSTDNVSTWHYVWFEILSQFIQPLPDDGSHTFEMMTGVSQARFFSPNISNGSVITAQIRGPALTNSDVITIWRNGVYSNTTGWPTCGTYYQGRVWFGGVVSNRFDCSMSNGFVTGTTQINMAPTSADGTVSDDNGISYICDGPDVNEFLWMEPDQQGILFGTQAGEWLISAPGPGALTPTNIQAVRVTKVGCADIEPRRAEHTLLFVQRYTRKIMEYFADVFSGKFSAPNLSERAKHLTVGGIAEIAYQQELAPILWQRRADGVLVGATYKRDTLTTSQGPNIIGYHRHQLGSGRLVESLCVGPSFDGNLDTLSMVTNDPLVNIRHIELMSDLLDEGFALTDCRFLDNAIIPSSTVVQAGPTGGPYGSLLVNGLWDHNGKKVTAFIAGLDCGDYTVANGSITVPFGDGVSGGSGAGLFTAALVQSFLTLPAVVGFTYNSDGQLVRPVSQSDTGSRAGPGFAKLGRNHLAGALLYGCVNGSISFGTSFSRFLDPAKLSSPNGVPYPVNQLWSGIWRSSVDNPIDYDGMICFRVSRPLPAFVTAVGGFDSKADA